MRIKMDIGTLVRGLRAVALATCGQHPDMLIEIVGNELRFVATDGRWLVEWRESQKKLPEGAEGTRVAVSGPSLVAAIPTLIKFAEDDDVRGSLLLGAGAGFSDEKLNPIRIEHALGAVTINGAALSTVGPYMDKYEAMVRPARYPLPEQYFGATADYLGLVTKAFRICRPRDANLLMRTGGSHDPIHITSELVPQLTVILMPMIVAGRNPSDPPKP